MKKEIAIAITMALLLGGQAMAEEKNGCNVVSVDLMCVEGGQQHKVTLSGRDLAAEGQIETLQRKQEELAGKIKEGEKRNAELNAALEQLKNEKSELARKMKQLGSLLTEVTNLETPAPQVAAPIQAPVATPAPTVQVPVVVPQTVSKVEVPPVADRDIDTLQPGKPAYIAHSSAPLHSRPDKASHVVTNIKKGEKVEIIREAGGGWYHIGYKGQKGYTKQSYLGDSN